MRVTYEMNREPFEGGLLEVKKNLALLLLIVFSLLILPLIYAGCTTQPNPPLPSITPQPQTPESEIPLISTCSTKYQTFVEAIYSGIQEPESPLTPHFAIFITFDKEIFLLDENPDNWEITVYRSIPYLTSAGIEKVWNSVLKTGENVTVIDIKRVGARTIEIFATVEEYPFGQQECIAVDQVCLIDSVTPLKFYGLICGDATYNAYFDALYGTNQVESLWLNSNPPYQVTTSKKYKDTVKWAYKGALTPIGDVLGAPCPEFCGLSGEGCCEVDCVDCGIIPCPAGETCSK